MLEPHLHTHSWELPAPEAQADQVGGTLWVCRPLCVNSFVLLASQSSSALVGGEGGGGGR